MLPVIAWISISISNCTCMLPQACMHINPAHPHHKGCVASTPKAHPTLIQDPCLIQGFVQTYIQASSRQHPGLIHASSKFHPSFIQASSGHHPDLIEASSKPQTSSGPPGLIQASSRLHPGFIHTSSSLHASLIHASLRPHPSLTQTSSRLHLGLIRASSTLHPCLIRASSMLHPCFIQASSRLPLIWASSGLLNSVRSVSSYGFVFEEFV